METVYRGGGLKGRDTHSFWTTSKDEAMGYASLKRRPEDRVLLTGQIPKGKYAAGDLTIDGNIPESWADIQRAIPNDEVEQAVKILDELTVPEQVSSTDPGYPAWKTFIDQWDAAKGTPTAKLIGLQDDGDGNMIELFNIIGGPSDGSTVTIDTLRRMGITPQR